MNVKILIILRYLRKHKGMSWISSGSVVVKALRYKPDGRVFDTRLGEFLNLPNPSGRINGGKVVSPTHPLHFTPQKHYFYVSGTHFC
jgi:hypothetical protein